MHRVFKVKTQLREPLRIMSFPANASYIQIMHNEEMLRQEVYNRLGVVIPKVYLDGKEEVQG